MVSGDGLGRKLGFPTANIETQDALAPLGVYEVRVSGPGLCGRAALCNVGARPTVKSGATILVEVHIPGFKGDLYGRELTVSFVRKIRDEKKFPSLGALREQIRRDVGGIMGSKFNQDGNLLGRAGALLALAALGLWLKCLISPACVHCHRPEVLRSRPRGR